MNGKSASLLLLFLALGPLLLVSDSAAQDAWPAKGDSLFIAASFKNLSAKSGVPGARMRYDLPACAMLRVMKAQPKKNRWVIEDRMGGEVELIGPWLARMHKGKIECEAQLGAEGEPNLGRDGNRFTLPQAAKGAPAAQEKPK